MNQRKEAAYDLKKGSFELKVGLAEMLRGGVIIDVTTPEQARIAEDAGAVAVMAVERISADIFVQGGVSRMLNPELIKKIQEAVSIPVMAKCRLGHFVEAQILEALFVDFIDESEVLTPADQEHHINKHAFRIPFVCGCSDLGEALRRIGEGASLLSSKGESGTGSIVNVVRNMRSIQRDVRRFSNMDNTELMTEAKKLGAPYRLVQQVAEQGKLPVPIFASGGITTPADAAMLMQLGAESVFVGSGIFKSSDPASSAKAIIGAVSYHKDPEMLAKISRGLLSGMPGVDIRLLEKEELVSQSEW